MGKRQITRKEFFTKTLSGVAGISLLSNKLAEFSPPFAELRSIGNTGIMATPLCFVAPRTNEESLIKYALDKGINFIDTGRSYGNGNNERMVGRAIKGNRKNVIIQSKFKLEDNELPSKGKGRKGADEINDVLSSKLEASLKALDTDYIDVLLLHGAENEELLFHEGTMKFFADMKSAGIIKAHGFSTHSNMSMLIRKNISEFSYDIIMVPFNHQGSFIHSQTGRYSEWNQAELIAACTEAGKKGAGIIAMKTCSGGKYSPGPDIEPSYKEAVSWILKHKVICSAAIAMASFEEVDEHTSG
jgi:aryl-alcohol dehydrogenase-like predicted oxidoreductase